MQHHTGNLPHEIATQHGYALLSPSSSRALSAPLPLPPFLPQPQPQHVASAMVESRNASRYKTLKHVDRVDYSTLPVMRLADTIRSHSRLLRLFHGNVVLDSVVPTKLLNLCVHEDVRKFTHRHYSATTGDPNAFKDNGSTLHQLQCGPPRRTELSIAMTIYNEANNLFTSIMHGVIKVITCLGRHWARDDWKKVVVCIVSDGRQKINSRALSVVTDISANQQGIATEACSGTYI